MEKKEEDRFIYLDYNATTPLDEEVQKAMLPYLTGNYGNPSSGHKYGRFARKSVEEARKHVAKLIGSEVDEVIFTSGGTEAINYALKGYMSANKAKGNHIITSSLEHYATLEVCKYLSKNGYDVTFVGSDQYGAVIVEEVKKAITPKTILISLMHANNEVGTIQPIEKITQLAKQHNIAVHVDAAQSLGKIKTKVTELGVDMLSLAGHKLYAPKGVGALYVKKGIILERLIHGAGHEGGKRAGTENVLEIVGLGKACEIAERDLEKNAAHMKKTRDFLLEELKKLTTDFEINGNLDQCLPNTLSVGFSGIKGFDLMNVLMDKLGISVGAACHSDKIILSHVLKAMKVSEERSLGTIRLSTGRYSTEEEIKVACVWLVDAVQKLKKSST